MKLQEVNKKFVYKTDLDKYGINELWIGLVETNGKLEGDCEDYSITLKRQVAGFQDWNYWYCKLYGDGHCILVDRYASNVIDNNTKGTTDMQDYLDMYDVTELRPYKWYELLWKFGSAKVISFYLKLRSKL